MDNLDKSTVEQSKAEHYAKNVDWLKSVEIQLSDNLSSEDTVDLLNILLIDRTMSKKRMCQHNIFWATADYEYLGKGYEYKSQILPQLITGDKAYVIKPRVFKSRNAQTERARDMAEVFTPAWVCNLQNNKVDEFWFGRTDVFNRDYVDKQGVHHWEVILEPVVFPDGKTWQDYVLENRLEITCGEAPYLISRYDAVSGELIPIEQRIGLLDRKLRVVGENTKTIEEWFAWIQEAYKSTYAYEWHGDSLLIARASMLLSFVEYYQYKFGAKPSLEHIKSIAHIISWNVWQMDGLKGVVPKSCEERVEHIAGLFAEFDEHKSIACEGCLMKDLSGIRKHNGIYCWIMDWQAKDPKTGKKGHPIKFVDLIKA